MQVADVVCGGRKQEIQGEVTKIPLRDGEDDSHIQNIVIYSFYTLLLKDFKGLS